jgi:NACHT domain.
MESFVNRVLELRLVDNALGDLLSEERLLRTPIIDFYGVPGIGKSSILLRVHQKCAEHKVPCIHADVGQNMAEFSREILKQATPVTQQPPDAISDKDMLDYSIQLSHTLLAQGPLVLLLDAVDTANGGQFARIERLLDELIVHNKLLVVVASRKLITFEYKRNVARKLTNVPLLPFDRQASDAYLATMVPPPTPALRDLLFSWTNGYPLAMKVMVELISTQTLDPLTEDGKKELIHTMVEQIITTNMLENVDVAEKKEYQTELYLLSVPRRFNLVIMQKLIEHFEPVLALDNSLAYIGLLKRITQATGALSWRLSKAGYAIDEPVRNILLLQMRTEDAARYFAINSFLAELNRINAAAVSGSDRIHYQREFLYHSVHSADVQALPLIIEKTVIQILQDSEMYPEDLVQFHEEFMLDDDLRASLSPSLVDMVSGHIYKKLAQIMWDSALHEKEEAQRYRYLRDYFYYVAIDPTIDAVQLVLKEKVLHMLGHEKAPLLRMVFADLDREEEVKEALGEDAMTFIERVLPDTTLEG